MCQAASANWIILVYLLLKFVRIMLKCGGLTPAKPAISEVQEICDLVTKFLFLALSQHFIMRVLVLRPFLAIVNFSLDST